MGLIGTDEERKERAEVMGDCPACGGLGWTMERSAPNRRPEIASCATCCRFGCDNDVVDHIKQQEERQPQLIGAENYQRARF